MHFTLSDSNFNIIIKCWKLQVQWVIDSLADRILKTIHEYLLCNIPAFYSLTYIVSNKYLVTCGRGEYIIF